MFFSEGMPGSQDRMIEKTFGLLPLDRVSDQSVLRPVDTKRECECASEANLTFQTIRSEMLLKLKHSPIRDANS